MGGELLKVWGPEEHSGNRMKDGENGETSSREANLQLGVMFEQDIRK